MAFERSRAIVGGFIAFFAFHCIIAYAQSKWRERSKVLMVVFGWERPPCSIDAGDVLLWQPSPSGRGWPSVPLYFAVQIPFGDDLVGRTFPGSSLLPPSFDPGISPGQSRDITCPIYSSPSSHLMQLDLETLHTWPPRNASATEIDVSRPPREMELDPVVANIRIMHVPSKQTSKRYR